MPNGNGSHLENSYTDARIYGESFGGLRLKTMKKIFVPLIATIALFLTGRAATPQINPDAFVYILNIEMVCGDNPDYLGINYKCLANGFAVSKGNYILTAAHCLQSCKNAPLKLCQPIVISPYYGDLFEARIVAIDKTNDVAVLEVPWDTHPALQLETSEPWKKSRTIQIAGYPPRTAERGGTGMFSRKIMVEETRHRFTKGTGSTEIQLGPVKHPGKGWSGSPLINPETGKVAGILTSERYLKTFILSPRHIIMGCSVDSINRLTARDQLQKGSVDTLVSPPGSTNRFEQILGALDEIIDTKTHEKQQVKQLCEALPRSCLTHLLAGWVLPEKASYLLKAIEIDPDSTLLRAAYGRELCLRKKYEEATEQFQAVIDRNPDHLFANYGLLVSLSRSDLLQAETLGQTLTTQWPKNAVFWFEYSKILKTKNKHEEQLSAIQKAGGLSKDIPHLYQRHLADAFMENGKYEESDQVFQELLKTHECEHCWKAYAFLLSQMGPNKAASARLAAKKANGFKAAKESGNSPAE